MQYKPMLSPDVPVDLSNCDREPIHAPSLSQPHGVDLAARISDMRIGEARLKAIVDNVHADVGGWDLDLLTGKVFLSPAIRRIFGIHEGYVLTLDSVSNLFVPEDRPALGVAVRESIANGIGFDMENRLIRGDGTPIWVRSVGSVEYADGKPVRLSGAFQDITARVGERHELERTRERLGLAVESGAIGIWDFDISSNELIWDSRM